MKPLILTDEDKIALRKRERVENQPTANIYFRVCPICASFQWSSTHPGGTGTTEAAIDDVPCYRCEEMHYRHGELFDYLLFAMKGQFLLRSMMERGDKP